MRADRILEGYKANEEDDKQFVDYFFAVYGLGGKKQKFFDATPDSNLVKRALDDFKKLQKLRYTTQEISLFADFIAHKFYGKSIASLKNSSQLKKILK